MIRLRRVDPSDCQLLFEWANDPATRANSATNEAISWPTHQRWFATKLADPDAPMFVAMDGDVPVGLVRFDVSGAEAEIGVTIAPEHRGEGLASIVIRHGCAELLRERATTVVAYIREENVASQKAFTAAGFTPDGRRVVRGVEMLRFITTKTR